MHQAKRFCLASAGNAASASEPRVPGNESQSSSSAFSRASSAPAIEHFEANRDSELGRIMFRLLDEYVVRPHDRMLFPYLLDPEKTSRSSQSSDPGAEFLRTGREAGSPPPAP
jgi:hypothetical protein